MSFKNQPLDNIDIIWMLYFHSQEATITGLTWPIFLFDHWIITKETGFNGDLVLGIYKNLDTLRPGVEEYLRSYQISDIEKGVNIVVYSDIWT